MQIKVTFYQEVNIMKVLVAKRKNENKLRYYNGKCFVIGKSRAIDVGKMNTEETINKYTSKE